jgi:hypothetical protein
MIKYTLTKTTDKRQRITVIKAMSMSEVNDLKLWAKSNRMRLRYEIYQSSN